MLYCFLVLSIILGLADGFTKLNNPSFSSTHRRNSKSLVDFMFFNYE